MITHDYVFEKLNKLEAEHSIECKNSRRPLDRLQYVFAILTLNLTLIWPFDPKSIPFVGYPKIILCTKFEDFEIIHFELSCGQTELSWVSRV